MKARGMLILLGVLMFVASIGQAAEKQGETKPPDFSMRTATPSEECGTCHVAIYREYAMGFGGDLKYRGIIYQSAQDRVLTLPANVSTGGTDHSLAGEDRILSWVPDLKTGAYRVQARLVFVLNRYNQRSFTEDLTETGSAMLAVTVQGAPLKRP